MTASSSDPMRDAGTTRDSISSLGDDRATRTHGVPATHTSVTI